MRLFAYSLHGKISEIDGRAIGVLFTVESKKFYVICVYVPATRGRVGDCGD